MSYISDLWLYPLQDWWRTVNEMSNFLHTGEIGNFIKVSHATLIIITTVYTYNFIVVDQMNVF